MKLNKIEVYENSYNLSRSTSKVCAGISVSTLIYAVMTSNLMSSVSSLPTPHLLVIASTMLVSIMQFKSSKEKLDAFLIELDKAETEFSKEIGYRKLTTLIDSHTRKKSTGIYPILKKFKVSHCYRNKFLTHFERARLIACYNHIKKIEL